MVKRSTISDGADIITFEFDSNATVVPGNIPVTITAGATASQIAFGIISAINSSGVQSRLGVTAADSAGKTTAPVGDRIDLFGICFGKSCKQPLHQWRYADRSEFRRYR